MSSRWIRVVAASLSVASLSVIAHAMPTASPSVAPLPGLAGLRTEVEDGIRQGRYPGAVFAVARGDHVLDIEAVGVADIDTGRPMRVDSVFRMMSMTKTVTAVSAMMLVEEGKLKLDDPVSKVLPAFATFGVAGAPPLTLRHLLTHTSGIGFGALPSKPSPLAQRASEAAARPRTVPAGKEWAYSGVEGPDIIARMVEVAAGEPFERFAQRRIFDPLGMKDTGWSLTAAERKRLVGLYGAKDGKIVEMPSPLVLPDQPSGGYGLYSTAPDYLRLVQMLAGDGKTHGVRLLTAASVAQMRSAQLPIGFPGLGPGLEQGFLMRRVGNPVLANSRLPIGAYGWSGAYGTHFWIDPATGLSAIWMINLVTAGGAGSPDALAFENMVMKACSTDRRCSPR